MTKEEMMFQERQMIFENAIMIVFNERNKGLSKAKVEEHFHEAFNKLYEKLRELRIRQNDDWK